MGIVSVPSFCQDIRNYIDRAEYMIYGDADAEAKVELPEWAELATLPYMRFPNGKIGYTNTLGKILFPNLNYGVWEDVGKDITFTLARAIGIPTQYLGISGNSRFSIPRNAIPPRSCIFN